MSILRLLLALLTFGLGPSALAQQLLYIHTDHLNTPRMVTDGTGTPVWRWDQIEPFGDNPPDEDPDGNGGLGHMPLRFPGQYFDKETNLAYNYFRDYDSGIGRYVQSDPIGLRGGLNTYAYVSGNPVRFVDPTGTTRCDVDTITDVIREAGLGGTFHGFYTYGDLPPGKRGQTNKLDLEIVLPRDFLECKSDGEVGGMTITILHEIMHINQNIVAYGITNLLERAGNEAHNDEAFSQVNSLGLDRKAIDLRQKRCRCECGR
jgi:RHS repeat-associated protein